MLYSTLNQAVVFIVLFIAGSISFLPYLTLKIIKNNIAKQLFYIFFIVFCFFSFEIVNLVINYGQFRLFSALSFLLGITVSNYLIRFLWTKFNKKCYNLKHGRKKEKKN